MSTQPVRCDRWGDHPERSQHHGYGSDGREYVWSSKDEVKLQGAGWQPRGGESVRLADLERWVCPVAARRIDELERQIENQAELIRDQREELQALYSRAEA